MSRMTTFHFQTHVSDNGMIALPLMPETFHGEDVTVRIDINAKNRKPNAELREAMEDVRLKRNLHGPFGTAKEALHSMLED